MAAALEVSSTPRPHFTPGKEPVHILQEPQAEFLLDIAQFINET